MRVTVQASGLLRMYVPASTTLEDVQCVDDVIGRLELPQDTGLAILVNGHIANWATPLQEGDIVQLVPQLSGGESVPTRESS